MIQRLRSIRPLDAAILGVAIVVIGLVVYLGSSIYLHSRSVEKATPVSRSIVDLQKKIRKQPNDITLRMDLAQAYSVAGKDDEAIAQYEQILKLKKQFVPALSGIGFVSSRQGEWEKAEDYWRRVIMLLQKAPRGNTTKQYETATFYLGNALLEQRQYEKAAGYFKESLRVNRSASDTHYLLAVCFRGLGADEDYKRQLEITLAFDPMMPQANYDYGRILVAEGNIAGAAENFRIAADKAPSREEPKEELAKLGPFSKRFTAAKNLADSKPKDALIEARVAVALEPRNVDAQMLLGKLYEKRKKKPEAAETYRTVLKIQPDNSDAKAALERTSDGK